MSFVPDSTPIFMKRDKGLGRLLARLARYVRGCGASFVHDCPAAVALADVDIALLGLTETLRVATANTGAERLLGQDIHELLGTAITAILPGFDREILQSPAP